MTTMLNKSIREDYLFELCRTCNDLEKFKQAIQQFEKQSAGSRLDENNNLILTASPQNAIFNLRDADGRTLLHHCVANYTDQQACCQYLIQNYPQLILTPDYQGYTIVHLAVLDGNVKLLKFICIKGRQLIAEPVFKLLLQSSDNELHSAIHWAVICTEYACLDILIETIEQFRSTDTNDNKSNHAMEFGVNMRDIHGATCLHYASMLSAKSKFFELLSEANKINRLERESNSQRKRSDSGMIEANSLSSNNQKIEYEQNERIRSADKKIALKILSKILHTKNVQVNCRDNDQRTPLMWSARLGESKAIKELLAAGADVNAQDNEGRTAMHCAATKGDKTCIETLFKHGNANINSEDKNGSIPLHYAAKFGSVDACRSLLNLGSSVDSINFRGQSVIHCAASKGNYWICRALVEEFDADLWKRDAKGELALHYAVRNGNKELVKWILSMNPSAVNVGNNFGRTCLHLASQTNNIQLCKLLIDCGASINALMKQRNFNQHLYDQMDEGTKKTYLRTSRREKFGISMVTPLDLALQRNFRNCAHFLVLSGAFPAAKLGLNNIMSKSNPNLYLDPEEGSKDSGDSTFESELIQNELNSTFDARHQSPYMNGVQFSSAGMDNQQFNIYNKQNELRMADKLKKPTMYNQVHSNQYSADFPNSNSNMNPTDRLIDGMFTGEQQKRSHSQPVFTTTERRSTSHNFVQSENGLDINQYALVQNSSGSSMVDYSIDDLTKTQSIVTNVYLNCNHQGRHINPIRKRKMKLIKTYSSQRNLNYNLTDFEENNQMMNRFNSLANLIKGDELKGEDSQTFANDDSKDAKKMNENLFGQLMDTGEERQNLNDDLSNTSDASLTELKNLKISSDQQKVERPTKLNQLKEEARKSSNDSKGRLDISKLADDKRSPNEDCSNKTDSRCSHYLHHKPEVHTSKYNPDFSHVKPKVDTRQNINLLKAQSNLLRSKSNLEDLALDELDEAGEIMQNAEKSLRKYQIERKLLQELQDLKRYQIRSNQVNEAVFVKRLAEQFRKQNKHPGMPEFFGPYTYKNYEKYLYDQIRKLSTSNEGKVPLPLLNIINMNSISVYDRPKHGSSHLIGSKKISKSTDDTNNKTENQIEINESKVNKFNETLASNKLDAAKKETLEMPIKVTSLTAMKRDLKAVETDESGLRKTELRPNVMDYAQTDENETLQDISTSFSEEKFDSLPEQMTNEGMRKQFHETFKSMSILNEEMSDQESSLNDEKADQHTITEVEKQPPLKTVEQSVTVKEDRKSSLTSNAQTIEHKSDSEVKQTDQNDLKSSIKETKKISIEEKALPEMVKPTVKVSFQQVNQLNKTVNAFKDEKTDDKFENENFVKMKENEKLIDENNNEIFKELGEIIVTNVTNVQKIFTANYLKQEQSELINKGWVIVDSIKEIDEKEDEIRKEEVSISEIKSFDQTDEQKQNLMESVKKDSTKDAVKSVEKQNSEKLSENKESREHLKSESLKTELQRQNSMMKYSSEESLKERIIEIENNQSDQKTSDQKTNDQKTNDQMIENDKEIEKNKQTETETIKKKEIKSLSKAKSESSSLNQSKSKKSSSVSSSSTSSDSKIPKLSNKKFAKLSSTSTSSTPSKKMIITSKSSSTSTSSSTRSSPNKKTKALSFQTAEKADQTEIAEKAETTELQNENSLKNDKAKETKKTDLKVGFKAPSFDKTIIFDEDKITTSKIEESKSNEKLTKTISKDKSEEIGGRSERFVRKSSVVSFEPSLLQVNDLNLEQETGARKKYAKTPIKQLSLEEKENLVEKLNDEELSVPTDDREDDSSPQSLNEEINKELMRKEKNDLIENMDKQVREESIKRFEDIEKIAVKKLIDEEQKMIKKQETKSEVINKSEKIETINKTEKSDHQTDQKIEIINIEKVVQVNSDEPSSVKKEDSLSKVDLLNKQESSSKEMKSESENGKEEKLAKADTKSEIIYKKSSIEKTEDISERTAYIENMLRTSGYTEKIIEKASEFINGKDGETKPEDGVVEEVTVKLVKKNSKDYFNGKELAKQQSGNEKKSSSNDKETKADSNATADSTRKQPKEDRKSTESKTNQSTIGKTKSTSEEKPTTQLKKSTSLSKIPTLHTTKNRKQIEVTTCQMQRQEDEDGKMISIEQTSFRRNCLKPLQTKSEPIEQAYNRPEFKRKKSNLPPKYLINLNNEQIKKKWHDIKSNEKDKLQQHQSYSNHLRRTTSNPVISNSFDLIYEVNKMPKWAQNASNTKQSKNSQQPRSNTTSIITQTKRILEKVEKKEIEEITTRTIINAEENYTTKTTSREESKTHRSETEESSISGKQCAICKKIIIPLTEEMKFCKKDLRKMLSDSALEIKHCRC